MNTIDKKWWITIFILATVTAILSIYDISTGAILAGMLLFFVFILDISTLTQYSADYITEAKK